MWIMIMVHVYSQYTNDFLYKIYVNLYEVEGSFVWSFSLTLHMMFYSLIDMEFLVKSFTIYIMSKILYEIA